MSKEPPKIAHCHPVKTSPLVWVLRYSLGLLLIATSLIVLYLLNDKFTPESLYFSQPTSLAPLTSLEQSLLKQKFSYIGEGSQFYAFAGEDQRTVLKILKYRRYKESLPLGFTFWPPYLQDLNQKKNIERRGRLAEVGVSCQIAQERLRHETGLLSLHLKPSKASYWVLCEDRLGRRHQVNLAATLFVLQERATPFALHFRELIENKREEEAKRCIDQIILLLNQRYSLGIFDKDASLHKNAAFLKDRALFIDIGQYELWESKPSSEHCHQEVKKVLAKFSHWLNRVSPQLGLYLQERLSEDFE